MPKKQPTDLHAARDVILGNQYNLLVNEMGAFEPPADLAQLRKDYLAHIERSFHALDFKASRSCAACPANWRWRKSMCR